MKSNQAVQLFMNRCLGKGLSPNTIRWYGSCLHRFATMNPKLPLKPERIDSFLADCKGDERRHGYYRTLKVFYGYLEVRYHVRNPFRFIEQPKRRHKEPRYLNPPEIQKLLNTDMASKIRTAIMCMVDTGARLSEVANLQIDDLGETTWGFWARVDGKTGVRRVPISYETYHALMVNLPFSVGSHWLGVQIARLFHQAGVKGSAHTLRHTFGTLWKGDLLVLQRIMGHSNLSTTKRYRHLQSELIFEEHSKYSPLKMVSNSPRPML